MNIFEVSDREGDKLSIDVQEEFAHDGGRFIATTISHKTITVTSVIFADDAARALIKALRGALPPELADEPAPAHVVPTYQPKRADYIRQAIDVLQDSGCEFKGGDVVDVAHFLANGDRS